jgi:hypothetical protein
LPLYPSREARGLHGPDAHGTGWSGRRHVSPTVLHVGPRRPIDPGPSPIATVTHGRSGSRGTMHGTGVHGTVRHCALCTVPLAPAPCIPCMVPAPRAPYVPCTLHGTHGGRYRVRPPFSRHLRPEKGDDDGHLMASVTVFASGVKNLDCTVLYGRQPQYCRL